MDTQAVQVERYVEQVLDGTKYAGYMKIANTKLDFEVVFTVPIPRLDDMEPVKGASEVRRIFQVMVMRNSEIIELTDDEYGFFFSMLVEFAVMLYNEPQTRAMNNDPLLRNMMHRRGGLADCGGSVSTGIKSSGSYDFPLDLCEALSAPKFGCGLVAVAR